MNTSLSYSFPKTLRLRTRRDFLRLTRGFTRRVGQNLIIDFRQGSSPEPKLGLTVSRKYGKSHERNRFKRLVREAYRLCQHQIPEGLELNIKPRSQAKSAVISQISQELLLLIS